MEKMTVANSITGQAWVCPCGRWFDRDEDDGQIERELNLRAVIDGHPFYSAIPDNNDLAAEAAEADYTREYTIHTKTADVDRAGTGAEVYIELIVSGPSRPSACPLPPYRLAPLPHGVL